MRGNQVLIHKYLKFVGSICILWPIYSLLLWAGIHWVWQVPHRFTDINPTYLEVLYFVSCVNMVTSHLTIKDFATPQVMCGGFKSGGSMESEKITKLVDAIINTATVIGEHPDDVIYNLARMIPNEGERKTFIADIRAALIKIAHTLPWSF